MRKVRYNAESMPLPLSETERPRLPLSRVSEIIKSSTATASELQPPHLHHLATQVRHNLEYQHDWTSLQIHSHSPLTPSALLARPILSGFPPQKIYVHPDEQEEMLKHHHTESELEPAREWVLPTHLKEKWSLRKFAEIFDRIGEVPPEADGQQPSSKCEGVNLQHRYISRKGGKRLLLATVNDDSTVVYYIVHDGIVKPRQN